MNGKRACFWAMTGLAVAGWGYAARAAEAVASPEALGFVRPSPEPALPAGFEPFLPPATAASPDQRLPTIAEWTRQAGPGDAIALAGAHLDDPATRFTVFGDTAGGGAKLLPAEAVAANRLGAVVTLPAGLAAGGTYLLWAGQGERRTMPVAINRTDAWWIGPSAVRAGASASVYGRNLLVGGGAPGKLYLKPAGAAGRWIDAAATSNPYKLDFTMPRDMAPGAYRLWAHNGRGGHYGWSGPIGLTVIPDPDAWSGPTIDVRRFGAVGDGRHDDSDALAGATQAAERMPRSTISLPRGTYLVGKPLAPPANVRWLGAGRDLTTIRAAAGFAGQGLVAMGSTPARGSNSAFGGMTLDGGVSGDGKMRALVVLHGQSQVRFSGVRFRSAGKQAIGALNDASRVFFDGCEFAGGVLFAGATNQLFITRSTFRQGPGVAASIQIAGGGEAAVSRNSFANLDPARAGQGRAFVIQGWGGAVSDIYFADNRTQALATAPDAKDQNTGEQVMFETPGVTFSGEVASGAPSGAIVGRISRNELRGDARRSDVAILSGTGTGQVRRIVAFEAATGRLTVDQPWLVVPDATSRLAAGGFLSHAVVYRNVLAGMDDWNTRVSASAGVEFVGNAYDNIVDANVVTNVFNGIYVAAMNFEDRFGAPFQVSYFNLFKDNRITNARRGIATFTTFYKNASPGDVGMLGNSYRSNATDNTPQSAFLTQGCNRIEGGLQLFNIFARNTSRGAGARFSLDNRVAYLTDNIKPPAATGPGSLMIGNIADAGGGIAADRACPYYAAGNSWPSR